MLIYCDLSPLKYPGKEQISTPVLRQGALSLSSALVLQQASLAFPCQALTRLLAFSRTQHFSGARAHSLGPALLVPVGIVRMLVVG